MSVLEMARYSSRLAAAAAAADWNWFLKMIQLKLTEDSLEMQVKNSISFSDIIVVMIIECK